MRRALAVSLRGLCREADSLAKHLVRLRDAEGKLSPVWSCQWNARVLSRRGRLHWVPHPMSATAELPWEMLAEKRQLFALAECHLGRLYELGPLRVARLRANAQLRRYVFPARIQRWELAEHSDFPPHYRSVTIPLRSVNLEAKNRIFANVKKKAGKRLAECRDGESISVDHRRVLHDLAIAGRVRGRRKERLLLTLSLSMR